MKRFYSHISYFFALAAIVGLFGSIMHYHSEGLECIAHAGEAHYVENDDLCPICTLVVDEDFESNLSSDGFISPAGDVIDYRVNPDSQFTPLIKLGRAPPSLS